MGRLSHIDDVEKRNNEQKQQKADAAVSLDDLYQAAPAPEQKAKPAQHAGTKVEQAYTPQPASDLTASRGGKGARPKEGASAQEEADFHGLNDIEKTSGGHLALIALSVLVLIAIVFYIFNYMN